MLKEIADQGKSPTFLTVLLPTSGQHPWLTAFKSPRAACSAAETDDEDQAWNERLARNMLNWDVVPNQMTGQSAATHVSKKVEDLDGFQCELTSVISTCRQRHSTCSRRLSVKHMDASVRSYAAGSDGEQSANVGCTESVLTTRYSLSPSHNPTWV